MNDAISSTGNSSQQASNVSRSQNFNSSLGQLSSEKVTLVIRCSALLVISLVGVFGNTLILAAIRTTPSLWTKSNMLLAALTSSHFIMSTIILPVFSIFNLWVYVFADSSCYNYKAIAGFFPFPKIIAHSIYAQFIIIAVDRYIAIIYPFHYETKMTVTVIKCLIGGSYVFGLIVSAIYYSYLSYINWSTCGVPYSTVMTAVIDCSVLFTVMLVTVVVYGRILLVAFKHRAKISSMTVTAAQEAATVQISTISNAAVVPTNIIPTPIIKKTMREFKAARMTAALVCAYTLPLIFYEIGRIMQACGNMQPYSAMLIDIGAVVGNLNSGFDWVIYGMMNRDFLQAFYRLLKIKTDNPNSD